MLFVLKEGEVKACNEGYRKIINNFASIAEKWDISLNCSNQLSYMGVRHLLLYRKTSLYRLAALPYDCNGISCSKIFYMYIALIRHIDIHYYKNM